jgi:VIT1/CCC1 family predicted Fe2+/Mn2+ transporter
VLRAENMNTGTAPTLACELGRVSLLCAGLFRGRLTNEDSAVGRRTRSGARSRDDMTADEPPPTADQVKAAGRGEATHPGEPHAGSSAGRLNWLRAGVLGADDGIVSVAGLVIGVAGATASRGAIFTAGLAGLVAGAVSMSLGEYVSVSSQRDSESALLAQERRELAQTPDQELAELTALYEAKGLSAATARTVAAELTAHDAFAAHAEAELHVSPDDLANPVQAAAASALSFIVGALLPLLAILLPPSAWRVPVTFVAVLAALALTGAVSARIGGSSPRRSVLRVVVGGAAGLALTYGIGHLFGSAVS